MNERSFFRFGAGALIAGGFLGIVFNALHPRSSGAVDDIEGELELIQDNGIWLFDHIGILVAVLLILPGLVAFTRSITRRGEGLWARAALYSGIVGVSMGVVAVAIDGIAMKEISDLWAASSDKTTALIAADVTGQIAIAIFDSLIITLFGVTPLFFAAAIFTSDVYPRWIGALALASGALGLVVGLVQSFAGLSSLVTNVLFPIASFGFTVASISAGFRLWKVADETAPTSAAAAQNVG